MGINDKSLAKQKAIIFLERSVETLSMIFGVNPSELDSNSANPFDPSELPYHSYNCLLSELQSLEKLKNAK
jgi:hypothetical protein